MVGTMTERWPGLCTAEEDACGVSLSEFVAVTGTDTEIGKAADIERVIERIDLLYEEQQALKSMVREMLTLLAKLSTAGDPLQPAR